MTPVVRGVPAARSIDADVDRIPHMSATSVSVEPKRSKRRELIISELLDKATELFAAKGYEATSLQDIADAVGVSRPALYHYLRSKDDLLAMLVRQMSHSLAEVLAQLRGRPDLTPIEKVRHLTALLVRERATHPGQFRILDHTEMILPEPAGAEHLAAKRRIVRELITIIEEGIQASQIRPTDARTAAFSLLGMCNWTAWWIRPQDANSIESIVETMVSFADSMLASPTSPAGGATPRDLLSEIRDRIDRIDAQL